MLARHVYVVCEPDTPAFQVEGISADSTFDLTSSHDREAELSSRGYHFVLPLFAISFVEAVVSTCHKRAALAAEHSGECGKQEDCWSDAEPTSLLEVVVTIFLKGRDE